MNKKLATLGVSLGLAAGGAAGLAFGHPSLSGAVSSPALAAADTSTTTADASTAANDSSASADRPDPSARLTEVLAPLVADGTLTQDQADKVTAALAAAGPIGGGHRGGRMGGGPGLDAAATALGVTADELRTELQGGSSIAEIATAKGVDVQTVIDAMVAAAKTHLDEEVASGEHTQAEADTKLADITTRITSMVNGELPQGGPGMGGRGDHGQPPADAPAADASTSTTTG